jgi:hypothetical protein
MLGVMDFYFQDGGPEPMVTGKASRWKQRKIHVDIEALRLERGETVRDVLDFTHGFERVQSFPPPKSRKLLDKAHCGGSRRTSRTV